MVGKRSANPEWSSEMTPKRIKKSKQPPDEIPPRLVPGLLQDLPLMIRAQICSYLDADSQEHFYYVCRATMEATEHHWKAKRKLSLSPTEILPLFPEAGASVLPALNRFHSFFDVRFELITLAGWLPEDRLRGIDFTGVEICHWILFLSMIEDEYGHGKTAALFRKVTSLRLDGCAVSSDQLIHAAAVLPNLETICLSENRFHLYDEVEAVAAKETTGVTTKKRTQIASFLKRCFPKIRAVRFC